MVLIQHSSPCTFACKYVYHTILNRRKQSQKFTGIFIHIHFNLIRCSFAFYCGFAFYCRILVINNFSCSSGIELITCIHRLQNQGSFSKVRITLTETKRLFPFTFATRHTSGNFHHCGVAEIKVAHWLFESMICVFECGIPAIVCKTMTLFADSNKMFTYWHIHLKFSFSISRDQFSILVGSHTINADLNSFHRIFATGISNFSLHFKARNIHKVDTVVCICGSIKIKRTVAGIKLVYAE